MKPWYLDGVYFKCTNCGNCCAKEPGAVFLSKEEIDQFVEGLKIARADFLERYTRKLHGKVALKEHPNFDCVFLKDQKCTAYKYRPKQCRTYPFWPELLRSTKSWDAEKSRCEGLDHPDGEYFSFNQIR
ncbi:MAG: YkgJ family cysteine cluster protein, partial [Chlamydiia bacterium]